MSYPNEMKDSLGNLEASRKMRLTESYPKLDFEEKEKLIELGLNDVADELIKLGLIEDEF